MAKVYALAKHRRGRISYVTGSLKDIREYFGYTIECGHSWNKKIPLHPKSIKTLCNAINNSYDEKNEYENSVEVIDYKDVPEDEREVTNEIFPI